MEMTGALAALESLGQPTRLSAFRLLVQAGTAGMAAGDIARALHTLPNTLSPHLGHLHAAGLVTADRQGRSIRYAADMDGLRLLLGWLLQDCCGGRPETCAPVIAQITCAC
jgi:ArsR family transcriptional regulator, arsenate/arsenite/antimonite-responsive transcriptional repressor